MEQRTSGTQRDPGALWLPSWGRVVPAGGVVAFEVVGDDGRVVEPISEYLRDFKARGHRDGSVRSYAHVLLRWWRFLQAIGVGWDRATPADCRDFVLWLQQARKPISQRRTRSAARVGTVNAVTRKQYLTDQYAPRTVRHSNAVLRAFYEFWIEEGGGPLVNPVPVDLGRSGRAHAHHNPMQPFRAEGRLRFNPPVPRRRPRAMPDLRWDELFGAMTSDRDRAILALAVSTAARAGELIQLRSGDVDWGEQLIRVRRKGSDAEQWLAASPDAFVWLRLYLAGLPTLAATEPVWWTLRQRGGVPGGRVPLTYDALRAVLRRANEHLGANWTMHDLRHTCALRMTRAEGLSLRDVQTVLGHAQLSTTQIYLVDDDAEVIARVRQHLTTQQERATLPPAPPPADGGYRADDLAVLFGSARP